MFGRLTAASPEATPASAESRFSLTELRKLHKQLHENKHVDDANQALVVEILRVIAEMVVYGDNKSELLFDFFCEKNMLSLFLQIMSSPVGCPSQVHIQILQTLSILISCVRNETSLYYLLSNNYIPAGVEKLGKGTGGGEMDTATVGKVNRLLMGKRWAQEGGRDAVDPTISQAMHMDQTAYRTCIIALGERLDPRVWGIGLSFLFAGTSVGIIIPCMPLLVSALDIPPMEFGLVISLRIVKTARKHPSRIYGRKIRPKASYSGRYGCMWGRTGVFGVRTGSWVRHAVAHRVQVLDRFGEIRLSQQWVPVHE